MKGNNINKDGLVGYWTLNEDDLPEGVEIGDVKVEAVERVEAVEAVYEPKMHRVPVYE